MLHIQCNGCRTSAYVDCACATIGHDPAVSGHHPQCQMADLGATVTCPRDSGCCDGSAHPGISHDAAANACPEVHEGHACAHPDPAACPVWANTPGDGACPGGHHGKGVRDCTVCRPVTITVMPGSTVLQLSGA